MSASALGGGSPVGHRLRSQRKVYSKARHQSHVERSASSIATVDLLSCAPKPVVTPAPVRTVAELCKRIQVLVKRHSSSELLDRPILVARLHKEDVWDEYGLQDDVPLLPKYMFLDDNLDLLIIEFPTEKHEAMAREILCQLRDQCRYVRSIGSGRRNHMEADERICPKSNCPHMQLPPGVSMDALSTLVVEVGLSQNWTSKGGLDAKAKKWFQQRNSLGLQFILCVKIDCDRHTRAITDVSYKPYDINTMNGFQAPAATHLYLQANIPQAQIHLEARRVLSIPVNQPLPQGFNGNSFLINLEEIRDEIIADGY